MPEDYVKIKKETSDEQAIASDGNYYPYGTSLSFQDDMVDELGVGDLAIGDVVEIRAYAFVESKSEHASKEHSSKSVSLQITSIKISREDDDRVKQLYGE